MKRKNIFLNINTPCLYSVKPISVMQHSYPAWIFPRETGPGQNIPQNNGSGLDFLLRNGSDINHLSISTTILMFSNSRTFLFVRFSEVGEGGGVYATTPIVHGKQQHPGALYRALKLYMFPCLNEKYISTTVKTVKLKMTGFLCSCFANSCTIYLSTLIC